MIFYFSGTGNTRWAAEQIARATGDRLLFIPDELQGDCRYTPGDDERIGFCFPVHGWQPPRIVRRFVRRLVIDGAQGHYCYALSTCGDSIGRSMELLANSAASRCTACSRSPCPRATSACHSCTPTRLSANDRK